MQATIDGEFLSNISAGIIVAPEYNELSDKLWIYRRHNGI